MRATRLQSSHFLKIDVIARFMRATQFPLSFRCQIGSPGPFGPGDDGFGLERVCGVTWVARIRGP
jgi:hypothetical protein